MKVTIRSKNLWYTNRQKRGFFRTSEWLQSHFLSFEHFSSFFFLSDIGVKYVASYCLHLRELSVSDCVQISDFGIYEVAKLGPNLRYLSVAKCNQITDAGVKQIARLCYKLRYLNVRGCESVSDDAIEMLARSCSRLRSLDIVQWQWKVTERWKSSVKGVSLNILILASFKSNTRTSKNVNDQNIGFTKRIWRHTKPSRLLLTLHCNYFIFKMFIPCSEQMAVLVT